MRVTRLAADGSTPAGATNMIVTNALIKVDGKFVYSSGDDIELKNACGNITLAYKDTDKMKRMDLGITVSNPNPELAEMIANGTLITSGGTSIGASVPAVGAGANNGVCLEVWSKAWLGGGFAPGVTLTDGVTNSTTTVTSVSGNFVTGDIGATISGGSIPAGATITAVASATSITISAAATASASSVSLLIGRPGQYWRHVWPKLQGNFGDFSIEGAPLQRLYNGPAQENSAVGNGPNNDFPSSMASGRVYSYFRDHALPSLATIGYSSTPAQS